MYTGTPVLAILMFTPMRIWSEGIIWDTIDHRV